MLSTFFFAQYYTEVKQIRDNISIDLRKGSTDDDNRKAGKLQNPDNIKNLLNHNEGFTFLQSIRGSYPYWCKHFMICLQWYVNLIYQHFSALLVQQISDGLKQYKSLENNMGIPFQTKML